MMINIENIHVILLEVLNKEIVSTASSLEMTNWLLSNSNIKETERISLSNKQNFYEFRLEMLKEFKEQVVEATEPKKTKVSECYHPIEDRESFKKHEPPFFAAACRKCGKNL